MKGLVIINPSSGMQVSQRTAFSVINRLLSDKFVDGIYIYYTRKKGDAESMAFSASSDEYSFVLAVGGDGTVNEVISGLYKKQSGIPLAILAAGTSNDFATSLKLPRSAEALAKMIEFNRYMAIDIGKFNDCYFLNVAAGGALPEVAHSVSINAKTTFGRLAYVAEGAKKVSTSKFDTVPLTFDIDGEKLKLDTFFFILANSKSVGGFSNIAPLSKINDGLLDLCIIQKVDVINAIPILTQIQMGTHLTNKCILYRQIKELKVYSEKVDCPFPLDIDGENGGKLPMSVSVVPEAINLLVPEKFK